MFYADTVGLKNVVAGRRTFKEQSRADGDDDFWEPAPLLKRLAESGESFAGFDVKSHGGTPT